MERNERKIAGGISVETLQVCKQDGIGWITFTREHVKNAINLLMIDELHTVLDQFQDDAEVKVLIFTGAGDTFISGGDLEQFMSVRGAEQALPLLSKVGELLERIVAYPKPTIAMINGATIGGGCEFAISCHFRFASEAARLGFVQIGMHITTGWGGAARLLDKLPETAALTLLLTGERVDARRAEQLGLVDGVYPAASLRDHVQAFAGKIAAQPLEGILAYMRILGWKRSGMERSERIRMEIEQCARLWGSDRHVAVVERFLKKK